MLSIVQSARLAFCFFLFVFFTFDIINMTFTKGNRYFLSHTVISVDIVFGHEIQDERKT